MTTEVTVRFWAKVDKSHWSGCWNWTAYKLESGYGRFRLAGRNGKLVLAHRFSHELHSGKPIPDGMEIDHKCHNPSCVNPDHLRVATRSQNQQAISSAGKNSRSGVRGISWDSRQRRWLVMPSLEGKRFYLGRFDTLESAVEKLIKWKAENGLDLITKDGVFKT